MQIRVLEGARRAVAPFLLAAALASGTAWAGESMLRPWPARAPTPVLKLVDTSGKAWDLDSLRGKVVVLNFWASWCGPCVDELPVLNELADGANGRLVVLGVNFKEPRFTVEKFAAKHPFRYPVLLDKSGDHFKQWTSGVMPTTILIDRNGQARWRVIGELRRDDPGFGKALADLLAQ